MAQRKKIILSWWATISPKSSQRLVPTRKAIAGPSRRSRKPQTRCAGFSIIPRRHVCWVSAPAYQRSAFFRPRNAAAECSTVSIRFAASEAEGEPMGRSGLECRVRMRCGLVRSFASILAERSMTLPRSIPMTHSTNPKEGSRDSLTEGQQEAEVNKIQYFLPLQIYRVIRAPDQEAAGPPSAMTRCANSTFWYLEVADSHRFILIYCILSCAIFDDTISSCGMVIRE